jgi:hypothetical protein
MVVIAFIHVFIAVLDRIIFLKQNRTAITLEFFYYNKSTGEKLSEQEYMNVISNNPIVEKFFRKMYLQKEDTNYPLINKYILHIIVVILSHLFIFWYLPIQGNINLHNYHFCDDTSDCNDFHYNGYLITFYIFYLCYIFFSALQIQYGLLDMRKKSLLMRGDNYFYSYSYKIFNAIPFLFELKLLIDWTITPTSLDLFKWIKFESIYQKLFVTHCNMKYENIRKVGEEMKWYNKVSLGGITFILVLVILLGPLLLFSNLNPTNKINNIKSSKIDLSLVFYFDGVFSNYSLFQNSQASAIKNIDTEIWKDLNLNETSETRNFPKDQIQFIQMSNISDTNWILAQPLIQNIKNNLQNYKQKKAEIYFSFTYYLTRQVSLKLKYIIIKI